MTTRNTSVCSTSSSSDSDNVEEERIVLHVYDDESKEFTSLTTYHGMIRIYTSETWPSRIFWGVVVVTCVTLFMIQGGVLLQFYHSHPTATKTDEIGLPSSYLPAISICPYGLKEIDELFHLIVQGDTSVAVPQELLQNSSRSVIASNSFACNDVVESISIENGKSMSFCQRSRAQITDIGVCFTFDGWKNIVTSSLKLKLKGSFKKKFTAHVHSNFVRASRVSTHVWVEPGTHSKVSFGVEEKHFLSQKEWGTCDDTRDGEPYNHLDCLESCLISGYTKGCGCRPYFDRSSSDHCSLYQLKNCSTIIEHSCNCPVQCYSQHFILQPLFSTRSREMESTITFQLNSKRLKSHQQYKRFKQIDLMSYIGGVMGLFLGMSCITLLEVFIYLVKTIFGTLNDTRHKEFAEKLVSEDVESIGGSHEEIIITQKHEKQLVIDEDSETIRPRERKFSMMPPSMRFQFHRPNHVLRRNSVYLGACDF